jgi:arginyl-tRNA synthetase
MEEVRVMAEKELKKREKLPKTKLEERSRIISLAAIKYMLLKVDARKNMLFNPKKSISFEGNTGPYILYSYARASSIMKKAKEEKKFEILELQDSEINLVKKLSEFPEIVQKAYLSLNPALVANYSYLLAQAFNEFYHDCKVIGSEEEAFRLALVQAFRQVLKNSLWLLGIETLEEM